MPELQNQFQKRQIAYKARISDILNGSFIKDESSAGHLSFEDVSISRVNIIATAVFKPEQGSNVSSVVIDDGTGKILLRSFENAAVFSNVDVGDFVLVIGKVREFNGERYVVPEILKKINNAEWVNVRKLELKSTIYSVKSEKAENKDLPGETGNGFNDEIYALIKKLDSGDGALVDDVVKESNNGKAENIIIRLLENGDIFEISPGKLKVLE